MTHETYMDIEADPNLDRHLYWVFNDIDFQNELNELDKDIRLFDAINAHKYLYYTKSYPRKRLRLSGNQKKLKQFLDKWCIERHHLRIYYDIKTKGEWPIKPKLVHVGHGHNGYIELYIDPNITKKDYVKGWDEIQDFISNRLPKITKHKRKPLLNDELVYAIYKARQKNYSFRQIFQKYQNGSIENHSFANTTQFKDEESLERYYRKYKPNGAT